MQKGEIIVAASSIQRPAERGQVHSQEFERLRPNPSLHISRQGGPVKVLCRSRQLWTSTQHFDRDQRRTGRARKGRRRLPDNGCYQQCECRRTELSTVGAHGVARPSHRAQQRGKLCRPGAEEDERSEHNHFACDAAKMLHRPRLNIEGQEDEAQQPRAGGDYESEGLVQCGTALVEHPARGKAEGPRRKDTVSHNAGNCRGVSGHGIDCGCITANGFIGPESAVFDGHNPQNIDTATRLIQWSGTDVIANNGYIMTSAPTLIKEDILADAAGFSVFEP